MRSLIYFAVILASLNVYAAGNSDGSLTHTGWTDPETKLVWSPETEKMSWGEAKTYCEALKLDGKSDWRLPTIQELRRSVCKVTGYGKRKPCPKTRASQNDILSLSSGKKTTYWSGDVVPGDPYSAYYFMLNKEGKYALTSKGDRSKARCVNTASGNITAVTTAAPLAVTPPARTATATATATVTETKEPRTRADSMFYVAGLVGLGEFFTSEIALDNYAYLNGELRAGFKLDKRSDKVLLFTSLDTGVSVKKFDYPVLTTLTVGPEYFFLDELSMFGAVGLGVLTTSIAEFSGQPAVTNTNAGLSWKAGITWQFIKWGDRYQYNVPVSLTYTGVKTRFMVCNTVLLSLGFMYFN